MEGLIAAITWFVEIFYNAMSAVANAVISAFSWPASALGVPPEILAAGALCLIMLALWRAMGGYFT